ncbi:MAG: type II toxin-antitoxin system RatA family toxin [Burkholderiales bacterium]
MAEVKRTVLVGHSAARMFELVDRVEDYPQFLPWCSGSSVEARDAAVTRATVHISFHGVKTSFSTANAKQAPSRMQITLISGPFRALDGEWRFTDLGGTGCRIEFSLRYQFSNRLLEKMVGPVFGGIAGSLVDAFVQRADRLHGAG